MAEPLGKSLVSCHQEARLLRVSRDSSRTSILSPEYVNPGTEADHTAETMTLLSGAEGATVLLSAAGFHSVSLGLLVQQITTE